MLLTLLNKRGYNLVYDMENKPQDYVVCVPAWDTGKMSIYLVYRAAKEDISQNNVWRTYWAHEIRRVLDERSVTRK